MKNKSKKIGFVSLMAVPAITSIACAYITGCAPKDKDDDSVAHLLDFNDLHGAAVGYGDPDYPLSVSNKNPGIERLAKTCSEFLVQHPNTVLLAGGDSNSSDCFSSAFHGETIYPLLKAMNVRHSSVGNHAFEWGIGYMTGKNEQGEDQDTFEEWAKPDDLKRHYFLASNIMNDAKFDPLYKWVYHEEDEGFSKSYEEWNTNRVQWADPGAIVYVGNHPIGLIGLTTQETKKDGNQSVVNNLGFTDYIASIHFAKHWLKQNSLPGEYAKIEAFVLLTHVESGQDEQTHKISGACANIAENIDTKISAIISAHSHKEVCGWVQNRNFGNAVWIGQAGTAGRALLDTRFKFSQPDPETGKCALEQVSMNIIHPTLENSSLEKAKQEILSIRKQVAKRKDDDFLKKVVDEFKLQNTKVIEKFDKPINNATTSGEIYPAAADRVALGHKYLWPSELIEGQEKQYVLEQMGGWLNYAQLEGFRIKSKDEIGEELKPAICFTSFDSITSEFAETPPGTERPIKYGDIYQVQTYENTLYYGYLTIGQLANIVEYLLAGRNKFNYENNPDYLNLSSLNKDYVTDESMVDKGLEPIVSCKYLCGPLQFWGMSFTTSLSQSKVDRDRNLSFVKKPDGTKVPKINICSFDDGNDLRHPGDWKTAESLLEKSPQPLIPILISSFVWTGGNKQNTMFKNYMEYNEKLFGNVAQVREFTWKTFDVIFEFLESVDKDVDVDLDKELVHSMATWS